MWNPWNMESTTFKIDGIYKSRFREIGDFWKDL